VQNFNYYSDHIEEYEEILNLVERRLEGIKEKVNAIETEPAKIENIKAVNDSVTKDSTLQQQLKRPRNPLIKDKTPAI
jgi:hypothetical protein